MPATSPTNPAMPCAVEMGPLERWALGDRLLEARLGGADLDKAADGRTRPGPPAPGPLGEAALAEVRAVVEALVAEVERPAVRPQPTPPPSKSTSPCLAGAPWWARCPGSARGTVLRCTYSKLAPKHRLRAWALFLALSAAYPELAPSAVTIGQAAGSSPRPAPHQRRARSARWRESHGRSVRRRHQAARRPGGPLPTGHAGAAAAFTAPRRRRGRRPAARDENPHEPARTQWASGFEEFPGEDAEPEHLAVLGPAIPFEQLLRGARRADEDDGTGWLGHDGEPAGSAAWPSRLWGPVLRPRALEGAVTSAGQEAARISTFAARCPGRG